VTLRPRRSTWVLMAVFALTLVTYFLVRPLPVVLAPVATPVTGGTTITPAPRSSTTPQTAPTTEDTPTGGPTSAPNSAPTHGATTTPTSAPPTSSGTPTTRTPPTRTPPTTSPSRNGARPTATASAAADGTAPPQS
jgi:hypothetical protein